MKNIKLHAESLKEFGNPGYRIGEFLLQHTNNPEYVVSQLEAYLAVARQDVENDSRYARQLLRTVRPKKFEELGTP